MCNYEKIKDCGVRSLRNREKKKKWDKSMIYS